MQLFTSVKTCYNSENELSPTLDGNEFRKIGAYDKIDSEDQLFMHNE